MAGILFKPAYRSKLEEEVGEQLSAAGVSFDFEPRNVHFVMPARKAKYLPDFWHTTKDGKHIIIEAKGRFGHRHGNGADVRKRLILAKEQNPDLDIRIIFQNASMKIAAKSKTTYAQWATDHGFKWSDKGKVPAAWIKDLRK